MKLSALRLLMIAAILAGRAFCQTSSSTSDNVAQYVKAEMARQHIPGLALLVSRDGEPVRAQGFGFSNVELQVPVKPETLFQSGSVGKQFAATAIMMLVEKGTISLDDSITKYFPEAPPTWKPVSVRHLLSHTGGFTDYPKDEDQGLAGQSADDAGRLVAPGQRRSFETSSKRVPDRVLSMPLFHITLREHTYTGRFYNDVVEAGSFAEALRLAAGQAAGPQPPPGSRRRSFNVTLREHTYAGRLYNDVVEAGCFAVPLSPGWRSMGQRLGRRRLRPQRLRRG